MDYPAIILHFLTGFDINFFFSCDTSKFFCTFYSTKLLQYNLLTAYESIYIEFPGWRYDKFYLYVRDGF